MELFITAFTIGLVGSFHCVGMCGPIAFALPSKSKKIRHKIQSAVAYNAGRITTYGLFGLFFGVLGQGINTAVSQQVISIVLGVLFILAALVPHSTLRPFNFMGAAGLYMAKFKSRFGKLLRSASLWHLVLIGLLNGLLPCGLVYAAIGGAIATSNTLDGALFMMIFGLGTLPVMFIAVMLSNFISLNLRNKIKSIVPLFLIAMGLLFILRGLNLDIPYLSPKINVVQPFIQDCAN